MVNLDSLEVEESVSTKNKRIAKNAIFLYCRMLFAVLVNLYASRLLLDKLGVENYGIYNIVGGVVALMMFVNSAMQGASSRFITYTLGKNDLKELKSVINATVHIHFWICILFVVIGETVGLWFVNTHLNIPEERMVAANWVYQFAILTSGLTILKVPFSASIISFERMNVYAFIEIFDVIARCAILFLLPLFFDRLIAYSVLLFVIGLVVFFVYFIYCKNRIPGFCIKRKNSGEVSKPIVSFALWSLFGDGTYALYHQGTNIIINNFFGVVVNAASGVATQASAVISTFVANVQSAFNPQIVKEFSADNIERMRLLMIRELEIMIYLSSLLLVPLFINMDYIMGIWLKEVPEYSVIFCQIMLICNFVQIITNVLSIAIRATGYNKVFSFLIGMANVLGVVLVWLSFKLGANVYFAYIVTLIILIIKIVIEGFLLNHYERRLKTWTVLLHVIMPSLYLVLSFILCTLFSSCFTNGFIKLLVLTICNAFIITILYYISYPQYRVLLSTLFHKFKSR